MANHEKRRKLGTWSTETGGTPFEGASDSMIDKHRPGLALDPGRRSRTWIWVLIVFVLLIVGGGVTAWLWGDDIAAWFTSSGESDTDAEPADTEAAPSDENGEETGAAATGATGPSGGTGATGAATGATTGSATGTAPTGAASTGGDAPPHAWPLPATGGETPTPATGTPTPATGTPTPATGTPTPTAGRSEVSWASLSTSSVSKSRVQTLYAGLPDAAKACISSLGLSGQSFSGSVDFTVGVKWNGSLQSLRISSTGVPEAMEGCIKDAIPRSRYPKPPPGKDGTVRASLAVQNQAGG